MKIQFKESEIKRLRYRLPGVFLLFKGDKCLHLDEAPDIREKLLHHFEACHPRVTEAAPTHFSYELIWDEKKRRVRKSQLELTLRPIWQQRVA